LIFVEAKGPGDSLSKEQYEKIEKLKALGVDAKIRWFEV